MSDHEQILEHESAVSELSQPELEDADSRSSPSAKVVHEAIRLEGTEELARPTSSIGWSGLAAGLTMGCSMLGQGILDARLPDAPWRDLVSAFGYSSGFLFVTMGRQQLFTETTLTVTLPYLHGTHRMSAVARYWAVVFAANIVGTILFALAATIPGLFEADTAAAFTDLGVKAAAPGFVAVLLKGVFAGWLIALMVWLLPAARSARFVVIIAVTWLIGVAHFSHVVAGSVETAFAAAEGAIGWGDYAVGFMLPALIGNVVGGVLLVAVLNHAQVREEI
ncbi:MAG: formate/nitrite transporter family protein [Sphingomicrobium sp.]|nr:formate/nitrite transporter family protein [Sphingomonadales bacterium]